MTIHSAFNGQVQFDCTPPNLKTLVVRDGFVIAVPESALFVPGTQTAAIFNNLIDFLGRTRAITFVDIGLGEDAEALQLFWSISQITTDYRKLWEQFILLPVEVHNEWFDAIQGVVDPRLLAPEVVQPGAPTDEALEATGTDGAKKKKSGKPT